MEKHERKMLGSGFRSDAAEQLGLLKIKIVVQNKFEFRAEAVCSLEAKSSQLAK